MRPLVSPEEAQARLRSLFGGGFDASLSSPLAGYAVACLLYVGAVAEDKPETWARPTTVLWQRPQVLEDRTTPEERAAWRDAAGLGSKRLQELLTAWQVTDRRRYEENSRESLRDETWRELYNLGAMRKRSGLATSSDKPRWALEPHFADLFDPSLTGDSLADALRGWVDTHLNPGSRLKATLARSKDSAGTAVQVTLPDGTFRTLEAGSSSLILKGVIEQWAALKLENPVVLAISEPGNKVFVGDARVLNGLGIVIDQSNLLPDALVADVGSQVTFWVIEAVATDGPITEQRKTALRDWARQQRIDPEQLRFLTAFLSRNAPPAKRRLKDLASGTYAWYLDEPEMELSWVPLAD